MKLLKFYAYIFYRFKNYYEKWQAVLVFNAILMFNMLSILFIYASINHLKTDEVLYLYYTNNYFYDRFILGTLRIGPIFLVTYLLSLIFKKKLETYYIEFRDETSEIKKKRNRGRILYFVFTVLFFIFSVVSSSFF
jgi:hypothetical protein